MMQNILSPRTRVILYSIYGYIGIVGGAVVAAYVAVNQYPHWLIVGTAVYLFLGKPLSQLAGDNVTFSTNLPGTLAPIVAASSSIPAPVPAPTVPATAPASVVLSSPAVATVAVPSGYMLTESGLVPVAAVPQANA